MPFYKTYLCRPQTYRTGLLEVYEQTVPKTWLWRGSWEDRIWVMKDTWQGRRAHTEHLFGWVPDSPQTVILQRTSPVLWNLIHSQEAAFSPYISIEPRDQMTFSYTILLKSYSTYHHYTRDQIVTKYSSIL